MSDIYVTLEEAAMLEGLEYHTFYRKVQRNADSYKTKTEASESGGKERIFILLSSLSRKAVMTYQTRIGLDINKVIQEVESQDGDEDEAWYVGVELNKYMTKYSEKFYKAVEMANKIKEYLEYDGDNKTQYTELFAGKLGMSSRNFRRKIDKYLEGAAWAIEMNGQDGKNYDFYKILALCPKPREKKYIALTEEMKAIIQNIWFDDKFAVNHRKQTKLYVMFQKVAELKGWVAMPSYQTVNRYINELQGKFSSEHFLVAQGLREFKRKKMLKRKRNIKLLKVMELVQGDGHTFDCWVKVVRPNGTVNAIRPVLVALVDTRSRSIVGWAVCEVPDSQVIKQTMMHMMYPKKNNPIEGVPRVLLIDNGKDWTAQTLTGRPRKIRVALDSEVKGFFKSIGIEEDMRSLPYQAWTKAQIERFFGTLCNDFTSEFNSYVGTLTGSKTIGKIKKNIKQMLQNDELLTIEEFAALFDKWLNEVYHNRTHSGLKAQKEDNPRPIEVFKNAERHYKAAPPMEYARVLLMKCEERTVYPVGMQMFNKTYQHELLAPFEGKKVDVRYNPYEPDLLHVYSKDGSKICEVRSFEGLNPIASRDDELLNSHIRDQKRQIRMTRENIQFLQTPYEERVGNVSRTKPKENRKVILPELSGEVQQIVTIPTDKQYRDELKNKKHKSHDRKSEKNDSNEFFNKQAEKAFAKLANL